MKERLYELPHKYSIWRDVGDTGFLLLCNMKFVYWHESIERVFFVYARQVYNGPTIETVMESE